MAANDDVPRTAVNQPPYGGTDYPFIAPSDLEGVVLDFYVSYYDPSRVHSLPFSLTISGTTLTVTDANSDTVASFQKDDCQLRAWGDRTVREWTADPVVVRMVHTADYGDGDGVLDPRTCNRQTAHVRSVRVGLVRLTGKVRFVAGYNVELSGVTPDLTNVGGRSVSRVHMNAVPGAGDGRLPGCDDVETVLRRINRVQPDCSGNFIVELDDCFRGQLPLFVSGAMGEARTAQYSAEGLSAEEAAHAIKLYSDCHPCCECSYYVRTYKGLKRVWNNWKTVATQTQATRDTHHENIERWEAARACREANPAKLLMSSVGNCKVAVGGSFCNTTNCCLSGVELRFTFRKFEAGVEVPWTSGTVTEAFISGSPTDGEEAYAPLIAGPVVRFFLDYADPNATSVARMKFCLPACLATQSVSVTLTVHVDTVLNDPETDEPCPLSEAEVEAEILSAWTDNSVPETASSVALVKTAGVTPASPSLVCGC